MKLLCRLLGHKLRFAGHGGEGDVYECVREKEPLPEKYWPRRLVEQASRRFDSL